MIKLFDNKQDCCGCTACMSSCPKTAILMRPDEEGFLYPYIDEDRCIECGLCNKVCAFQNGYDITLNFDTPYVYAVKHKEDNIRMSSSSGGAFTAISDVVLKKGGVIYGAAFDENMNVSHQKAGSNEERKKLKGSKYVQSDLKSVFSQIRALLKNDRVVLFSGTPCQVSGLKSFLNNSNMDKLILCDIVCHGTPSPLMWKEHIAFSESKVKSKIIHYYCRSKVKGWHEHTELAVYENGREDHKSSLSQKHKNLFYSDTILRYSCYNCKHTNLIRPSDITIGDFWGIENCMPDFDDNKGVSLVLVNTQKGKELFEGIKENIEYRESNIKDCLQPQLKYPNKLSSKREEFWKDYFANGYEYIIRKYAGYGFINSVKRIISKILSR